MTDLCVYITKFLILILQFISVVSTVRLDIYFEFSAKLDEKMGFIG